MIEDEKSVSKRNVSLVRFNPKVRNELVLRGLNALSEVRDANLFLLKGAGHSWRREFFEAIEAFKQVIRIDPYSLTAYCSLGVAYRKLGRYTESLETYKQAIRIKPDFAEAPECVNENETLS